MEWRWASVVVSFPEGSRSKMLRRTRMPRKQRSEPEQAVAHESPPPDAATTFPPPECCFWSFLLGYCLVSPLEAATGKGGNHSWQLTRQPRLPRTTVYKLFRVEYLTTVPNQYPKYTIPGARSLQMYLISNIITNNTTQ